MSPRRNVEHEEAVARRLAALSASLGARQEPSAEASAWPPPSWSDGHTRVRPVAAPGSAPAPGSTAGPDAPDPQTLEGIGFPVPGRHASRRSSRRWIPLLPPGLRGRVALGAQHVVVMTVLACLGLGVTSWWVVRSGTHEVVPVSTPVSATVATPTAATQVTGAPAEAVTVPDDASAEVVVDVAGKVRRPGIAVLPAGSRVVDALEAAGGARRGVDLTALNLARPLVDGEQVLVGGEPAASSLPPGGAGAPPVSGGLVALNSADQATLETLPGVGPVTASAILAWRESNGGFTSVDELIEVDGIGEKTFATLLPLVTL